MAGTGPMFDLTLDVNKARARITRPRVTIRQSDDLTQTINLYLTDMGAPWEAPEGSRVRLQVLTSDQRTVIAEAVGAGDRWTCVIPPQAASCHGVSRLAYFTVFEPGDDIPIATTEDFDLVTLPGTTDVTMVRHYDRELERARDGFAEFAASAEAAERGRVEAEEGRVGAELARAEAEADRDSEEQLRRKNEASRKAAENKRAKAEVQREANETRRKSQETERQTAEEQRRTEQLKNNADQAANNLNAQGITDIYLDDPSQWDPETLVPTIEGEVGPRYNVPLSTPEGHDAYIEWKVKLNLDGSKTWEQVGTTQSRPLPPATKEDLERIHRGETVESDRVMYTAQESASVAMTKDEIKQWVREEARAFMAQTLAEPRSLLTDLESTDPASFDGSADVMPGVTGLLPLANGGLGQNLDASNSSLAEAQEAARKALGAASQDSVSAVEGRVGSSETSIKANATSIANLEKAEYKTFGKGVEGWKKGSVVTIGIWAGQGTGVLATLPAGWRPLRQTYGTGFHVNANGQVEVATNGLYSSTTYVAWY